MMQSGALAAQRTCPQCRKENALSAEATEEIHEQDQIHSGSGAIRHIRTTTLFVTVSCHYCSFVGFTTLSKAVQSRSDGENVDGAEGGGAQDFPVIDANDAIQIVIERERHPRHRWTAPW